MFVIDDLTYDLRYVTYDSRRHPCACWLLEGVSHYVHDSKSRTFTLLLLSISYYSNVSGQIIYHEYL